MSSNIERYIEMEARERNMLRYESMLWGALSIGAGVGAAVLLLNGGIFVPILLGVVSLGAYIKRDEVHEEYNLKATSGAGRVSAKQWAEELGHTKLVDGKTAQQAKQAPKPEATTPQEQRKNTQRQGIKDQIAKKPEKNWEQTMQQKSAEPQPDGTPLPRR